MSDVTTSTNPVAVQPDARPSSITAAAAKNGSDTLSRAKEGSLSPLQAAANTLHALSRSSGASSPARLSKLASSASPQPQSAAPVRPSAAALYSSSPFNIRNNASLLSQSLYSNVGPSGGSGAGTKTASNGGPRPAQPDSSSPGTSGSPLKREVEMHGTKGEIGAGSGTPVKTASIGTNAEASAVPTPSSAAKSSAKEASASKRKKANRACFHCQKAHLTCDDSRPCQRCVKKGLADTCTDGFRKKAKYLLDDDELEELKRQKEAKAAEKKKAKRQAAAAAAAAASGLGSIPTDATPALDQPIAANPGTSPAADLLSSQIDSGQSVASHQSEPTFELAFDPTHNFGSEATSLEYSILSSMLNGTDLAPFGSGTDSPDFQTSPAMDVLDSIGEYTSGSGINGWNVAAPTSGAGGLDSILSASESGPLEGLSTFADPTALSTTSPDLGSGAAATLSELPTGDAGFTALEVPSPAPTKQLYEPGIASLTSYEADPSAQPVTSEAINAIDGEASGASGTINNVDASAAEPMSDTFSANRSASGEPLPDINKAIASRRNQRLQQDSLWKARVAKVYRDDTQPFPYPEGYHFLIKYATENFEKQDVLRIVRALAIFRPSLIALQMPLTEEDEIFVERSFQRTILEFEKLISFSGTPTVVWRRTCEICVVGAEFCMLTQWSREELMGRYIYEFMDKNSTLDYWEKFALHAFENTTQSVMTTCTLLTPQGKPVPCAWSFTIKRDTFDLPSLVVGNFLPVLS